MPAFYSRLRWHSTPTDIEREAFTSNYEGNIGLLNLSFFLSFPCSLESFGHFERHHFSDSRLVIKATFSQKVSFFQSFCNVTTSFDYNYKKYVPRPSKSPQSIKYPKYSLWMWSSFVTLIKFTFPYIIPNT